MDSSPAPDKSSPLLVIAVVLLVVGTVLVPAVTGRWTWALARELATLVAVSTFVGVTPTFSRWATGCTDRDV